MDLFGASGGVLGGPHPKSGCILGAWEPSNPNMMSFGVGSGYTLTGGPNTNPEFSNMIMEILHGGGEAFLANVAKTLEKQCETEGAGSHQSLWKPFRFWFVSLTFGTEVLALQSVTSWCQNWRSGAAGRRVFFPENRTFGFQL